MERKRTKDRLGGKARVIEEKDDGQKIETRKVYDRGQWWIVQIIPDGRGSFYEEYFPLHGFMDSRDR